MASQVTRSAEEDKQAEENKKTDSSTQSPIASLTSEGAEFQLPPASWLERLMDRLDRRSGTDIWWEADSINVLHQGAPQIANSKEYLALYKAVSNL